MALLLLLLLLLVALHDSWPNPLGFDPAASWLIAWSGIALMALMGELANRLACRALRRDPGQRADVIRLYGRWKRWHLWGLVGFFLIALYFFGWGETIHQTQQAWHIPGYKTLALTPLLAGLAFGWLRQYDVERLNFQIVHYPEMNPFLSRAAYFGLQVRHHLLFVLPPMLLLVVYESLLLAVPEESRNMLLMAGVSIVLLSAALIIIPLFLRFFLGLRPLPDGPLRQRLMATAARLRFRISDVLVWNTRSGMANAMVTGVLPWLRYVVVTDRLLEELNEDEIEAVFGHEVGHMKHHHMFFYMVFTLASLLLLGGLWSLGNWWFQNADLPEWLVNLVDWHTIAVWLSLGIVIVYILVVFGWLSRRCERQADIFGAKTASPAAFVSALEKVADLNGIPRDPRERPGFFSWWQHSTIADRVDFIQRMQADPHLEPTFQRRLGWTKWGVAMFLTGLVVTALWRGWDLTKFM